MAERFDVFPYSEVVRDEWIFRLSESIKRGNENPGIPRTLSHFVNAPKDKRYNFYHVSLTREDSQMMQMVLGQEEARKRRQGGPVQDFSLE